MKQTFGFHDALAFILGEPMLWLERMRRRGTR